MTTKLVSQTGGDLNWMVHRRWKGSSCSVEVTLKFARTAHYMWGWQPAYIVNYQESPVVLEKIRIIKCNKIKSETVHFIYK